MLESIAAERALLAPILREGLAIMTGLYWDVAEDARALPVLVVDDEVGATHGVEGRAVGALRGEIAGVHPMFDDVARPAAGHVAGEDAPAGLVLRDLEQDDGARGEDRVTELEALLAVDQLARGIEARDGDGGGAREKAAEAVVEEREVIVTIVVERGFVGAVRDGPERAAEVVDAEDEDRRGVLGLARGRESAREA